MFSKTLFAVAFAAIASVASAANPGCLLGAVNEYDSPSDIKAVCSAKDLTTQVQSKCGDSTKDALAAMADICNDAGVTICTLSSLNTWHPSQNPYPLYPSRYLFKVEIIGKRQRVVTCRIKY